MRLVAAAVVVTALLTGCSTDEEAPYVEKPVTQLYNTAVNLLENERYELAARQFDEVDRQHPYSSWATKAQLMAAYSHYQIDAYDDAIIALDRYIQLHPSNPDTAYAYYLKGLCYYEQISDVGRDQRMTELALKTLNELVARYPSSIYARDASIKIDLTRDHLAGKEMEIGRYYLKQGHYLAAINRFKLVVEKYQTTTHVPEALHRLTEAYLALGINDEAQKIAAVLGHNFPGTEWYVDSYQLVEGVRIREGESTPWYNFWDSEGTVEQIEIQRPSTEPRPWYDIWRGDGVPAPTANSAPRSRGTTAVAKPVQPASPVPPAQPATTAQQPSSSPPQAKDEPWYKFW